MDVVKNRIIIDLDPEVMDRLDDLMEEYEIKTRTKMMKKLILDATGGKTLLLFKELSSLVGRINHEIFVSKK